MTASSTGSTIFRSLALAGCLLALLCGVTLVTSGFGYRWGWWGLRAAFKILRWSAYGGAVAGITSLVALGAAGMGAAREGAGAALAGLMVSLFVVGMPWIQMRRAQRAPPIHDITTDTEHPPAFVAVLPLRAAAPNSAVYAGPQLAATQRAAYPDVQPAILPLAPAPAFERALTTARAMGWEIVATDSAAGRIEATATTFWYGFKDDVVIRVAAGDGGTRVDVRSESRMGGSDIGTNARRITAYLKRLKGA